MHPQKASRLMPRRPQHRRRLRFPQRRMVLPRIRTTREHRKRGSRRSDRHDPELTPELGCCQLQLVFVLIARSVFVPVWICLCIPRQEFQPEFVYVIALHCILHERALDHDVHLRTTAGVTSTAAMTHCTARPRLRCQTGAAPSQELRGSPRRASDSSTSFDSPPGVPQNPPTGCHQAPAVCGASAVIAVSCTATKAVQLANLAPARTRLHSVPSVFQFVTETLVFRNILKPSCRTINNRAEHAIPHSGKHVRCSCCKCIMSKHAHLRHLIRRLPEIPACRGLRLCKELVDQPDANVVAPGKPPSRHEAGRCQSAEAEVQESRRQRCRYQKHKGADSHGV